MKTMLTRLVLLGVLLLLPVQGWAGVLATDDFNRANGGLGANWTTITGSASPAIVSNVVQDDVIGGSAGNALYTAITWPNDQYAAITLLTLNTTNGREASVWLRAITAAVTGYVCTANGPFGATAQLRIRRFNAGAGTTLYDSGAAATVAANDVMKCEIVGSTISLYINGTLINAAVDGTPIASGTAGLGVSTSVGALTDAQLDNWVGGDFTPTTSVTSMGWLEVDE